MFLQMNMFNPLDYKTLKDQSLSIANVLLNLAKCFQVLSLDKSQSFYANLLKLKQVQQHRILLTFHKKNCIFEDDKIVPLHSNNLLQNKVSLVFKRNIKATLQMEILLVSKCLFQSMCFPYLSYLKVVTF